MLAELQCHRCGYETQHPLTPWDLKYCRINDKTILKVFDHDTEIELEASSTEERVHRIVKFRTTGSECQLVGCNGAVRDGR